MEALRIWVRMEMVLPYLKCLRTMKARMRGK